LTTPSLIDSAIEEFLRWATPVMQFKRTAMHDLELRGQQIKEGDRVMMYYSSAKPRRGSLRRSDPPFKHPAATPNLHTLHSAFGGGGRPTFCLGANLARLEMKLIFDELLRRVPDMELAGEPARFAVELHQRPQASPGQVHAGGAPAMAEAYIVDAVRTPVGKRGGGLSQVHPADLGAPRAERNWSTGPVSIRRPSRTCTSAASTAVGPQSGRHRPHVFGSPLVCPKKCQA